MRDKQYRFRAFKQRLGFCRFDPWCLRRATRPRQQPSWWAETTTTRWRPVACEIHSGEIVQRLQGFIDQGEALLVQIENAASGEPG